MMRLQFDNQLRRLRPLFSAALLLSASLLPAASAPSSLPREELFNAPVMNAGRLVAMQGRLCRPAQPDPARLVLLVHGSNGSAAVNAAKELGPCTSPVAWWFTQHGYAVATFLRPGYGTSPGVLDDMASEQSYQLAAEARARDIDATVSAATALRGIRPDGAVILGGSTGGLGAVAYDALPHPRVAALISFAGGQGGHCHNVANTVCNPPSLVAAVHQFGTTSTTPMLWVYAANDSFFPPPVALAMLQAFRQGGGSAQMALFPAFAADGHHLVSDPLGPAVWGPVVADYLARMGATP